MTPEQWHRVKEVFEAALGHAPEERSAFVGRACAGDDLLQSEVNSLLSSYDEESSFMETPAAAIAARSLLSEESAALVGQQLGHYQIVREIGRGGMGVVYLAQDSINEAAGVYYSAASIPRESRLQFVTRAIDQNRDRFLR